MAAEQSLILRRCPKCNCKMIVQRPSGETVIFQRAIIVRGGAVYAACPDCKSENEIESMSYNTTSLIVSESSEKKLLTKSDTPVTISRSGSESVSDPPEV